MELKDYTKLCIHTITTKPWSLKQAVNAYAAAGVAGITVWRQALEGLGAQSAGRLIRDAGLKVVSLCRGGFFPAPSTEERKAAIQDNLDALEEAAALGAPLVVLVPGAHPEVPLEEARNQIEEGIAGILPRAEALNVNLAIEPLHPMYADSRSAVNTLEQANDMSEKINSPRVGVAVDVYHLWWDPDLKRQIQRCGRNGNLMAFHICDWLTPTEDILNDRGLMGDGCIPVPQIREWVEDAGFTGFNEVEIFSTKKWSLDQNIFLKEILKAYIDHS